MNLGNLLFAFQGRVNRAKYWLAILIWVIAAVALGAIAATAIATGAWTLALLFYAVAIIPALVSSVAVGIKRLHDRDKSGWWFVVFYLVPILLQLLGAYLGPLHLIFALGAFAITIWAFVELGCLRGTVGANQYGPDPLAGMAAQPA
jgi:uncharacterized membrane protein YhaH (DUF805 family)